MRIPGATEKSHEGTEFVELPIIPALGPTPICACRLDDHSLLVAQNQTLLFSRLKQLGTAARSKGWHKAWKGVDGGLVALATTDANFVRPLGEPIDDDARAYSEFFTNLRAMAIGLDRQEQPDGVSAVKLQFRFDTEKHARMMPSLIRSCIEKLATSVQINGGHVENDAAGPDEEAQTAIRTIVDSLQQARITTRQADGVWVVDLQIAGSLDYCPLWGTRAP
jgi:hypothetical protein